MRESNLASSPSGTKIHESIPKLQYTPESIPLASIQLQEFSTCLNLVVPPSGSCCSALKDADIPCLCKFVTPDFEKLISMEKAMNVARTCGCKNIPAAGSKCGSYTVRPPPPPPSKA